MPVLVSWTDPTPPASGATRTPSGVADGMDLTAVDHYRVIVSADLTKTLSGAGNMRAYFWSPLLLRWIRNPSMDFAITNTDRDCGTTEYDVGVPLGRMIWCPDAVTSTGGAITTTIEASRST